MSETKETKPVESFKVRCWGCGFQNEINSKEHPYQVEIYKKKGHMVCLQCGLKFSESKVSDGNE